MLWLRVLCLLQYYKSVAHTRFLGILVLIMRYTVLVQDLLLFRSVLCCSSDSAVRAMHA